MRLVKGIHHVAMKCCNEKEYKEVIQFYTGILGLSVVRSWNAGIMLDSGSGLLEIFNNGEEERKGGILYHFAFAVDDVDACCEAVSKAGYEVFKQPADVTLPSDPPFPIRIAFCYGPLGEEIEFFHEYR